MPPFFKTAKIKEFLSLNQNHYFYWEDFIRFYLDESVIDDYKLRTELFSHVANVLQMVDSKGTNWRQRLESLRKEEEEIVMRISSQSRLN